MEFLIFVAVVATAYFAWRIVDQLPDLAYRLSEIQRDVADLRRQLGSDPTPAISADAAEVDATSDEQSGKKSAKKSDDAAG